MTDDSPTLEGRICLVTGGTSGIGHAAARMLAERGARVIITGRDPQRGERAREALRRATGADVEWLGADFRDLRDVDALADRVIAKLDALHVLVNNAGVYTTRFEETPQGHESTFAINHLAPFHLTRRLLPLLEESAPARVVNVASDMHWYGRLRFSDLDRRDRYFGPLAYAQSKLANVLFTRELARRIEGRGVTANAVHPGMIRSRLGTGNRGLAGWGWSVLKPFLHGPDYGARTIVRVATDPALAAANGLYFAREKESTTSPRAQDDEAAKRLWRESERMVDEALKP